MKKILKKLSCALVLALAGVMANADTAVYNGITYTTNGDVEPGVWTRQFTKAKAYADANHIPMVVFWGNDGCGYCAKTEAAMAKSDFISWQKKSGYVFVFAIKSSSHGKGTGDDAEAAAAKAIAKDPSGNFPYIGAYWLKEGSGTPFRKTMSGRAGAMVVKSGDLGNQLMASIDYYLGAYEPSAGGSFGFTATEGDHYEVVAGATSVTITLVRESSKATREATDELAVSGQAKPITINWAKGESFKEVKISVPSTMKAGEKLTLTLNGDSKSAVYVKCVTEGENTPKNAKWDGESFTWGEWTTDYAAAKSKVASTSGSYLLAMFSGVLWCPYCKGMENSLLASKEFKDWAKANKVALVLFDQGRATVPATAEGQKGPRLVTTVIDPNTTGAGTVSGRAYVSRKGVTEAKAAAYMNRVTAYTKKWLAPNATSKRLGNPTILLINAKDETVAGRLNATRDGAKVYDPVENVRRLGELLKLAGGTEKGKYLSTTPYTNEVGEVAKAPLQINENTRYFKVTGLPKAGLLRVDLTGASGWIWRQGDSAAVATNVGTRIEYEYSEADAGKLYVQVSAIEECSFESSVILLPKDTEQTYSGKSPFKMRFVKGAVYAFTGVDVARLETDGILQRVETVGSEVLAYKALKSDDVSVSLESGKTSATYQRYNPGKIGFVLSQERIVETDGVTVRTVKVSRTEGSTGEVEVKVCVDEKETTLKLRDGTPRYDFTETTLTWGDGEQGEKSVSLSVKGDKHYDGDGKVVLVLKDENGTPLDATYSLTVTENDSPTAGRVAMKDAGETLYVRQSAGAEIRIERQEGCDGAVSAVLKTTLGKLSATQVSWADGDAEDKVVKLTGVAVGRTATVSLSSTSPKAFAINSKAKSAKVIFVDDKAPEFALSEYSWVGVRYVGFPADQAYFVDKATDNGGTLSFKKISGKIPSGLSVVADQSKRALAFTGTPSTAGHYEAVYQVSSKLGSTTLKGLTAKFTFDVYDVTDEKASLPEEMKYNTSVVTSRTLSDIPVIADGQLVGTLKVTLPRTGKASAKLTGEMGTISFSTGKGWSDYSWSTGDLSSTLKSTKGYALDLSVSGKDGSVAGTITTPEKAEYSFEHNGKVWKAKDYTAKQYQGYYTVLIDLAKVIEEGSEGICPKGRGYLTLKMDTTSAWNAGKFTWAGMLPNGVTMSGSAVLSEKDGSGRLPIVKVSSSDTFLALARIAPDALANKETDRRAVVSADEATGVWTHTVARIPDACFTAQYNLYGAIYDKAEDLSACCEATEATSIYKFGPTTEGLTSDKYGEFGEVTPVVVKVEKGKVSVVSPKVDNPQEIKLSLNRSTGIVSGSFKLPYTSVDSRGKTSTKTVSATYRGVLLTGWGDCGCGETEGEVIRPFINGAYYFTDSINYMDGTREKSASAKRGGLIESTPMLPVEE